MRDERGRRPNGCPSPFDHDTNGHSTNGVARPGGPFTRVLAATDEAPVDLVAVQADDELVNALGARPGLPVGGRSAPAGGEAGGHGTDDRLLAMLAAWRAEIDAEPIPELVDLDAAVAAVAAGVQAQESAARRRRAVRIRQLAPLAAAAAIIVATLTGVGLGSQNAMPGDTLWPIQKVVNPERAESVEAKVAVEGRLQNVRAALKEGDTVTAARELEAIRTEIPAVRDEEGQPMLVQEQEFLAAKLADTPPGTPADLSTPPKSNPAARPTTAASSPASTTPSTGSTVTAPSGSASKDSTAPQPTEPDVRQRELDKARAPLAPSEPGGSGSPAVSQPSTPAPQVTSPPEATQPDGKPHPGAGDTEGGKDASTPPGPVQAPPAPETGGGAGASGGGSGTTTTSDTTTASGSAGASVETTATDTTTS